MYSFLLFALVASGLWLIITGGTRRRPLRLAAGSILAIGAAFFFWFMGFWGEMLWFEALGLSERFWRTFGVKAVGGGVVLVVSIFFVLLVSKPSRKLGAYSRYGVLVLAALSGVKWGETHWQIILQFVYGAPTETLEPVFSKPVGFYLFSLPLFDALTAHLLLLSALCLLLAVADCYLTLDKNNRVSLTRPTQPEQTGQLYRAAGVLLLILGLGKYLDRFHLLFSETGVVTGPGWTDVHILLPGLTTMAVLLSATGAVLLVAPLRRRLAAVAQRFVPAGPHAAVLCSLGGILAALNISLLTLLPSAFQQLRVEPNEITFEKPYIEHNIRMTRQGFRLMEVEEREFPAAATISRETVAKNQSIFNNIRLWDWRALDAVYKQFQEIRLYYEFDDVDVDRYTIDGRYQQVMVSAREMELDNLPRQSQTFVNRRFKFTHGYGITMTNVSAFTDQGLPDLLIRDIPPKSSSQDLQVQRPEIYFGELTRTPVLVNTREEEFDYPKGEANAYARYGGQGGVHLKNLWRKFLYGWKFDGLKLFFSGYPTTESRIMFHRQILERAEAVAPFLSFDNDPYIVLSEGKLYWIIDAYTSSRMYPYSERFIGEGRMRHGRYSSPLAPGQQLAQFYDKNYVRNSVKMVIDAYEGSVDIYVIDPEDPLIQTWQRIFPAMFQDISTLPEQLRRHIRYPTDMLLLQGLLYAKYHMSDPTVFYNQEDLWVRATEKYYNQVQPVEPYYIMWELPGSNSPEFVLMLPFTPKNRQVSIGWIAGMCDGDNYGRLLAYKFPKERRVLGPQQVETKIDQDRFLAGQLTLWDQRGSRVIRGNVLAIPVEETLIYVEPIYLQAETAAYPELRLVAVMHNDKLRYGQSFEEALSGLFSEDQNTAPRQAATMKSGSMPSLIRSAGASFTAYLQALGERQFQQAADALQRLEQSLTRLAELADQESGGEQAAPEDAP